MLGLVPHEQVLLLGQEVEVLLDRERVHLQLLLQLGWLQHLLYKVVGKGWLLWMRSNLRKMKSRKKAGPKPHMMSLSIISVL